MNYRTLRLRPLIVCAAIGLSTIAGATTTPSTSLAPPPPTPPAQVPETAAAHTQVEVLAYLNAIDDQLIALAQQALTKKIDREFRDQAMLVLTEMQQNEAMTRALAIEAKDKLLDTTDIKASREQAKNELEQLNKVEDAKYGSEFLKAMIAADGKALDLIDKRLLADAEDERIKEHLQATRTHIAAQMLRAQEVSSSGQ
jgi:putative membrane protein